jgi:Mrp family chromosome partitioning ATPase
MWGRGLREVESVYLATFGQGSRVVGITSVRSGSGVSVLAAALAERCQRQNRALLVGLSDPTAAVPAQATEWIPTDEAIETYAVADPRGFDSLIAAPMPEQSFSFRSAGAIRDMFEHLLGTYDMIVVDLAAVEPRERVAVPVTTVASACESVVVVCLAGQDTRPSISRAANLLRQAGAPLQGVVVNDRFNQTVGEELISGANTFSGIAPGLVHKFIDFVERTKILNTKP